jgi:hypothetical protein
VQISDARYGIFSFPHMTTRKSIEIHREEFHSLFQHYEEIFFISFRQK